MFEYEESRRRNLETKAQYYQALVLAFLTATFLSLPYLTFLQGLMQNNKVWPDAKTAITLLLLVLGLTLVISLGLVLLAMRVRDYDPPYPEATHIELIHPHPSFKPNDEDGLYSYVSRVLVKALQDNKAENDKKAKWVQWVSYSVIVATAELACLVGIAIYAILSVPPK